MRGGLSTVQWNGFLAVFGLVKKKAWRSNICDVKWKILEDWAWTLATAVLIGLNAAELHSVYGNYWLRIPRTLNGLRCLKCWNYYPVLELDSALPLWLVFVCMLNGSWSNVNCTGLFVYYHYCCCCPLAQLPVPSPTDTCLYQLSLHLAWKIKKAQKLRNL